MNDSGQFSFVFEFWATLTTSGLFQALFPGISPENAWGNLWDARIDSRLIT